MGPQRLVYRRHYPQIGLMDSAVFPAHAEMTTPECYNINVRVYELDPSENVSAGIGAFKIEIFTDAPEEFNQVSVSASVNNGSLVSTTSGDIYKGMSLIFGWMGSCLRASVIPADLKELTDNWICADSQTGSNQFELKALVIAEGAP